MTDYDIRAKTLQNESSNRTFGLHPFGARNFELEKRFFEEGERWSWSSFSSFALVGSAGGEIEFFERLLGLIFRYFGGEVVEVIAYRLACFGEAGLADFLSRVKIDLKEPGYFFGALAPGDEVLAQSEFNLVVLVRDPLESLRSEYDAFEKIGAESSGAESFRDYVALECNQKRINSQFEEALSLDESERALVRRLEDIGKDPPHFLYEVILFLFGHEAPVMVNDLEKRFIQRERKATLSRHRRELWDEAGDLISSQKELLSRFGYGAIQLEACQVRGSAKFQRIN